MKGVGASSPLRDGDPQVVVVAAVGVCQELGEGEDVVRQLGRAVRRQQPRPGVESAQLQPAGGRGQARQQPRHPHRLSGPFRVPSSLL